MKKINVLLFIVLTFCLFQQAFAIQMPESILQKKILNDINAYRLERGLLPLKLNGIISQQAENHSREMAENQVAFGHEGFNKRMRNLAGQFKSFHGIAENVAYIDRDANRIVKLWLQSPGHRKNIVGNFNLTGIGVAYNKNGRVYATQIFIRTNGRAREKIKIYNMIQEFFR